MSSTRYGLLTAVGVLFVGGVVGCKDGSTTSPRGSPSPEPASEPAPDPWKARHKNRTIQDWYDLATNKTANKLEREDAIGQLGAAGGPGLAALERLLSAADRDTVVPLSEGRFGISVQPGFVRWHAVVVLGKVGARARSLAPTVADVMLKDQVVQVRALAAQSLGQMGSKDAVVVTALKDVLRSKDAGVWQGAILALDALWPADKEVLELLAGFANRDRNPTQPLEVLNAIVQARAALQKHGHSELLR